MLMRAAAVGLLAVLTACGSPAPRQGDARSTPSSESTTTTTAYPDDRSPDGGLTRQSGTTTRAFFGLFTGNAPNPNAPDGTLTGTHPIGPVPAWLFLVEGMTLDPGGAGSASVGPGPTSTAPPTTAAAGQGDAIAVLSDPDGHVLTGVSETGSGSGMTGIA